jgi:hypothetical protein
LAVARAARYDQLRRRHDWGWADMPDYYSLLQRKVKETQVDPAKMRQVVYEAARLALKRQVLLLRPPIAIPETRRLLNDLEDAIARFEADVTVKDDLAESAKPEDDESGSTDVERNGRPEGRHEPDDVEDDETDAGTNRAAPEGRKAGGTRASRINGRYAFTEPEEDETPSHAPPTNDRRRRADLPSDEGLHRPAPGLRIIGARAPVCGRTKSSGPPITTTEAPLTMTNPIRPHSKWTNPRSAQETDLVTDLTARQTGIGLLPANSFSFRIAASARDAPRPIWFAPTISRRART